MAKPKDLLEAAFRSQIVKGKDMWSITDYVKSGVIMPKARYIQTFDNQQFWLIDPDATVATKSGSVCYLYRI